MYGGHVGFREGWVMNVGSRVQKPQWNNPIQSSDHVEKQFQRLVYLKISPGQGDEPNLESIFCLPKLHYFTNIDFPEIRGPMKPFQKATWN